MKLTHNEAKALIRMTDRESVQAFINEEDCADTQYLILTDEDARKRVYNMYRGDEYMLGCFNAGFLADFICLDFQSIEALQKAEAFEALGAAVINSGKFEDMMDEYIRLDGYGHALSSYDGNHEEFTAGGENLVIIRQS